uniref:Putative WRKY transcription factor 40 n=1 Tax=Lygus hesperus TaxID=30085 RepID=A0A0A9XDH5_LYGHE
MSNLSKCKLGNKMSKHLRTKNKTKTKLTFSIPDNISEESSLDENYLDNYSTESEYSDSKQQEPDEFSSGEELTDGNGNPVRLFPADGDVHNEDGSKYNQDRLDKCFAELRTKSGQNPSSSNLASVLKAKAKGDFALPDFMKKSMRNQHQEAPGQEGSSSRVVKPPDPKSAPEAVLRLYNREDLVNNRKVMSYLSQLEAAEEDVNRRLEANVTVPAEEIEALHEARNAILRKFGYDFEDKAEMKRNDRKARKREKRKNEFPSGVSISSSSESDDSERLLKEEVTRRVLKGQESGVEINFADLMDHSSQWMKCVKEEMTGDNPRGRLENMTKLSDMFFDKKK